MAIQIGCAQCGKKYRVDDKLLGKKIRCKSCQGVIRVEGEAAAAPVKAKAAAPVVKKAAPKPVASAPRGPQPEALDLPDLSDLEGLGDGPTIQPEEREAAPAADPACPSCGAGFPAANRVCLNCGYNRASGQKARTVVAKGSAAGGTERQASRVGSDGTRLWTPYANPVLNILDTWIPKVAMYLFVSLGLLMIVWPILLDSQSVTGVRPGLAIAWTVIILVAMGLLYGVVVKVTTLGVKIAGGLMKFEVPADSASRIMGIQMVTTTVAFGIMFIQATLGHSLKGASPQAMAAAMGASALIALVAYVAVSFACFMILFHLKFVEAILGYLLTLVFNILGWVALSAVLVVLVIILGVILGGVAPHR